MKNKIKEADKIFFPRYALKNPFIFSVPYHVNYAASIHEHFIPTTLSFNFWSGYFHFSFAIHTHMF